MFSQSPTVDMRWNSHLFQSAPRHSDFRRAGRIRSGRRGFSLAEVLISCLLFGTIASMVVPLVSWLGAERHRLDEQQWVQAELDNLLEELTLRPWNQLTPEELARTELSSRAKERLAEAELTVTVEERPAGDGLPAARRLQAVVSWTPRISEPRKVQLTAFVYQPRDREAP